MKQQTQCRCTDDYTCESCSDEIAKSFKQHITKEQWGELTRMQQRRFEVFMLESDDLGNEFDEFYGTVDIGCMIEFLGERKSDLFIDEHFDHVVDGFDLGIGWNGDNLCDALWEDVKHKLKETIN